MEKIALAIVEDNSDVRSALEEYLGAQPDFRIVRSAESVEEFLYVLPQLPSIDLLLLDIGLPGMSGLEGIELIQEQRPDIDIIMLTAFDDYDRIYQALSSGAVSYLSKRTPLPVIKESLLVVYQGGSYMSPEIARKLIDHISPRRNQQSSLLTDRQFEIVQGLVDGLSYKLIADKYTITVETVRDHIKKIYKKLQVNSRTEVIKKWIDGEI